MSNKRAFYKFPKLWALDIHIYIVDPQLIALLPCCACATGQYNGLFKPLMSGSEEAVRQGRVGPIIMDGMCG